MRRVPVLLALVALVAALLLSACGSSDDDSPASGGATSAQTSTQEEPSATDEPSASGEPFVDAATARAFTDITGLDPLDAPADLAELRERVSGYVEEPTRILVDEPVSRRAEAGKNIALLVCGVPVCAEFNDAAREAAEELGWRTTRIDLGVSPEEFTQAYNRAIEIRPDMVVGSGLPRELFDAQLRRLEELGIPVIQWSSGMQPVEGALWVATDDPLYQAAGVQAAEFIAADGELAADVAIFNVPQYTMSTLFVDTLREYLPKICPDCTVGYEEAAARDIGSLGQKVTGYVQKNPDTRYVICSFGDLCQGVGQALKAAGRDDVKIFTRDPGSTNFQNIANGLEWATSPLPIGQTGWQIIDLAQRIFNGDDTSRTRLQPLQVVDEIPDPSSRLIGAVPDYQDQYRALWQPGS